MKSNSTWRLLGLSLLGAAVMVFAFVAVSYWTVTPQDMLRRSTFWGAMVDPITLAIALPGIGVTGLLVFPLACWSLKRKKLMAAAAIVFGAALISTLVFTPVFGVGQIPVTLAITCITLVVVRKKAALDLEAPAAVPPGSALP